MLQRPLQDIVFGSGPFVSRWTDREGNNREAAEIVANSGYADRVAKKECIILFLRRCEDISKPFYTVEIRGGKIAQVRGMQNCDATPEVETFMAQWERRVLQGREMEDGMEMAA
ncbi:MAG: hypothetical protein HDT38_02205 [Clostridiales bacterium]|nr:hypothetical protein [Clostridiales bacterium]